MMQYEQHTAIPNFFGVTMQYEQYTSIPSFLGVMKLY